MQNLDGIQTSKQIKDVLPARRIIMFTASDDDDVISDAPCQSLNTNAGLNIKLLA